MARRQRIRRERRADGRSSGIGWVILIVLLLVIAGAVIWWLVAQDDDDDNTVDVPDPDVSVSADVSTGS